MTGLTCITLYSVTLVWLFYEQLYWSRGKSIQSLGPWSCVVPSNPLTQSWKYLLNLLKRLLKAGGRKAQLPIGSCVIIRSDLTPAWHKCLSIYLLLVTTHFIPNWSFFACCRSKCRTLILEIFTEILLWNHPMNWIMQVVSFSKYLVFKKSHWILICFVRTEVFFFCWISFIKFF